VESVLLEMTFSMRKPTVVGGQIETALDRQDVTEARRLVSWHLVSRDASRLEMSGLAAAAIESVAENASDGIMAPLLAYTVAGLPGVLAYRFVNTADSMLGYRDAAREWLGKVPTRLDGVLNPIPAQITALLLTVGSAIVNESARNAWGMWQRDTGKTASPNAGHPMSALAGALEVKLEKVDHFRLGAGQRAPAAADIGRAIRVMPTATADPGDQKMERRTEKHRRARPDQWHTLEVPRHVGAAILDAAAERTFAAVLVDCMTLLTSNLLMEAKDVFAAEVEAALMNEVQDLVTCAQQIPTSIVVVSNEVGWGLVPPYALGRAYRDLLGRANQALAEAADEVILLVAGIPQVIKPRS
jgi:adenosyl cobinamide kinase/adenosyl cobinamide phosphate guanylyltransferase